MWSLDDKGHRSYTSALPYPLLHLDGELLAAHAVVHGFKDWPTPWPRFLSSWGVLMKPNRFCTVPRLYYLLANSPDCRHIDKFGLMTFESVSQHLMHRSLVDALK